MEKEIYNKAISFLARRNYFSTELFNKLKIKFEEEPIKNVIISLIEAKFINDDKTALFYIKELQNKKFGKKYILNKLYSKGLDADNAKKYINIYYDINLEIENIKYLKTKKSKTTHNEDKSKIYNYLKTRGF